MNNDIRVSEQKELTVRSKMTTIQPIKIKLIKRGTIVFKMNKAYSINQYCIRAYEF